MHIQGSCLCGRVAFAIDGDAVAMNSCHCSKCRKAYASAFGTILVVERKSFSYLRGEECLRNFQSSERVNRPFCGECGSRLPIVEEWDPLVGIPAGLLDGDPGIQNEAHIFVADKAPWLEVIDDSPQHATWPPDQNLSERHEQLISEDLGDD